mgnify:FL=1
MLFRSLFRSTLPEASPREQEKYPGVDFRASKLRVNDYIKSIGLSAVFVALGVRVVSSILDTLS